MGKTWTPTVFYMFDACPHFRKAAKDDGQSDKEDCLRVRPGHPLTDHSTLRYFCVRLIFGRLCAMVITVRVPQQWRPLALGSWKEW
jgi:hypothetical protein